MLNWHFFQSRKKGFSIIDKVITYLYEFVLIIDLCDLSRRDQVNKAENKTD